MAKRPPSVTPSPQAELLRQALAWHQQGRLAEAKQAYETLLARDPRHFDALHLLGVLAGQAGQQQLALELLKRALRENRKAPAVHCNLGHTLRMHGRMEEALASYERALALDAGFLLAIMGRADALHELHRFEDALAGYDAALALKPDLAQAHSGRATVLRFLQRFDEALTSSDVAVRLAPRDVAAHNTRGMASYELGRYGDALASFRQAIALKPDLAHSHINAAHALLIQGDFRDGWESLERRTRPGGLQADPHSPALRWQGADDPSGKVIYVRAEQGLGDTVQFCRYLPLLRARGARVLFAVQPPLVRFVQSLDPLIDVVGLAAEPPCFDLHTPLLSLPRAFGTTLETIPGDVPYLSAEPERVARWRARIGEHGYRVGVCWQGNRDPRVDAGRSFAIEHLFALGALPGVRLICLQRDAQPAELGRIPAGVSLESYPGEVDNGPDAFMDTAAIIEAVDLVISPDTSVGHVAGALGKPTWLALKFSPDWRWLADRHDTPWYPNHRLFRQARPGDWAEVFDSMRRCVSDRPAHTPGDFQPAPG